MSPDYGHHILISILTLCFLSCTTQRNIEKKENILTLTSSIKTSAKMVSVEIFETGNASYGYVAGENETAEAYSITENGKLELLEQYKLSNKAGGTRAITQVMIGDSNLLLLGNKADDALEVHQINRNGTLEKINAIYNSEDLFIDEIVTIETVVIGNRHFIYAGGLDKGLSCFELLESGELLHVQSIADSESIFLHGIIGMSSLLVGSKRFLITGAFFDGGISSFQIMEDGKLKNIDNVTDDGTLYLNGAFPVNTVQLGGTNYLLVGHRHNVHYTATQEFQKQYHGDGINVFAVNDEGELKLHSLLKDDETLRLKGSTRIEVIKLNDKKAIVFIGTRDDTGIQICSLSEDGILRPIESIDLGFAIYNGMTIQKIDNKWHLLVGAYDSDILEMYAIDFD